LDYEGKSLKSQMRRADKLKARFALILGGDELKKGTVILRNMGDKSQEEVPIEGLIQALKEKIESN
jgi:histidyl-tRNA synthetase